ncbi:MAG: class I SAM-dependent methyltransferase [Candidatus Omnitrophica bacterium]|nr:class I SAM-dependent methyltransferase [Candidatus Omnitrophota bacterium]
MIKMLKSTTFIYRMLCKWFITPILKREWKHPPVDSFNERSIELSFAFKCLYQVCPQKVIDVGTGYSALPSLLANCGFHTTAIDLIEGVSESGSMNYHYHIINDDITAPKIKEKFDVITCISVLEHIPDHHAALKGMFSLLNPDGCIILTTYFNENRYVDDVYKLPQSGYGKDNRFICQIFSRKELDQWIGENSAKIVTQEYYQVFSGELWTFGERLKPPIQVRKDEKHHLTCLLLQKGES